MAANMFTRFDATKSTKGASKLRRDLINAEIANLRDLLPLPPSTRQRLSQLQLMALVCVYVRKANYFQQVFKRHDAALQHQAPTPNIGFSKALSGFLMMMTQNGKLLYISDNAAEYLGHSMEDLLIHGDSVYDIIDKQDHQAVQQELVRNSTAVAAAAAAAAAAAGNGGGRGGSDGASSLHHHQSTTSHHNHHHHHHHHHHSHHNQHTTQQQQQPHPEDTRLFLCRMNVSRNARRQMRFGDQKVVLVQGHFLSFLPLCSRNEPVFLATCTPVAMPETRECVVQGATNVFTSIHTMDMKFMHLDRNGEFHLGFPRAELQGASWYQLLHWDSMRDAQSKHRIITQSEQERACILLVRMQRRGGGWIWVHCVLQVKDAADGGQQPVIVCTNQVLSEREAAVMRANSWLYHYYMVQSKLQYGLAYEAHAASRMAAAAAAAAAASGTYYPPTPPAAPTLPPPAQVYQHHHYTLQEPQQPQHQNTGDYTENGYRYRREAEPVDYSVHGGGSEDERTPRSSPGSAEVIVDLDRGGTLLLTSISQQSRPRMSKLDPADMMEQWNPSPPWSDTTVQKVPDILHQELSPYHMTTPPTPPTAGTVAGPLNTPHTFTFDPWTTEQYVPQRVTPGSWTPVEQPPRLFPLQPPPPPRIISSVNNNGETDPLDSVNDKNNDPNAHL